MPVTKPFAVATEGATLDGRVIARQMIEDMAKTYDPAVYTATVNLEHFISFAPDSLFSAYGKVISLSTREADILGDKKLQLMAVADVSDAAAEMQYRGRKAFASVEIMPNFIGKGLSYLTGLALTDSPASVGTEPMRFSAIEQPGEKYASPSETVFDIEDGFRLGGQQVAPAETRAPETAEGFIEKVMGFLRGKGGDGADIKACQAALSETAGKVGGLIEKTAGLQAKIAGVDAIAGQAAEIAGLKAELAGLKAALESSPNSPARPPATGADARTRTDC